MQYLKLAITLSVIHLIYYFVLQVISDLIRIRTVKNTPNKQISLLRTQFRVNIKTFQKNTDHFGFAWFNTVYLNENLFRKEKALRYVFYHELYHVRNRHKKYTLLARFLFSLTPFLIMIHWSIFALTYVLFAYFMYRQNEYYEKKAYAYSEEMLKNEPESQKQKGTIDYK